MQNKTIINLSNKNISPHTVTALSKGLNYIPTPKPTPYSSIYTSFLKYRRNMYNRYLSGNTVRNTKHPFKLPTNFTAPIPDNSNLQEYISNVYYDIKTDYHITMSSVRRSVYDYFHAASTRRAISTRLAWILSYKSREGRFTTQCVEPPSLCVEMTSFPWESLARFKNVLLSPRAAHTNKTRIDVIIFILKMT